MATNLEEIKHPFYSMTFKAAMALARQLNPKCHIPVRDNDPIPTVKEAIQILKEASKEYNFNWITGRTALEVLLVANGANPEKTFKT